VRLVYFCTLITVKMRRKTGKRSNSSSSGNPVRGRSSKGGGRKLLFHGNVLIAMFLKLLLVLILFFLSRVLFFALNYVYFSDLGFANTLWIFFVGLRFDISAILIINLPFVIMLTIPFRFRYQPFYLVVANTYYYCINSFALMTNFGDTVYFRFTLKRLTADIFTYVGVGGDFDKLIPQFLRDFWFVVLIWLAFITVLVFLGRRIAADKPGAGKNSADFGYYILNTLLFCIIGTLAVVGIRGGIQLRPIGLVNAGKYASAKYIPLVLNTPFSIAKTFGGERLKTLTYYKKENELAKVYSPVHRGKMAGFKPLNVMIIMMESYSTEHIGSLNRSLERGRYQGFTPFLDSLICQGLYFDAYANGKTSIQGIPAVLSGIPSLMNESFIQSSYASGKYSSIAGLLKPKGYTSAFFHGGTNGTMGFDSYTKLVGFDRYYGRSEYGNEKDYDGKWGIRDEEFFQYAANTINSFQQPFISALFSLSSHHPYYVPAKYLNVFRKGKLPIQQSVMYADHSLAEFFHTVQRMPWYQNTLFVITADHTSEGYYPFYQSDVGQYAIPLLFFKPGSNLKGKSPLIAQQTDIMPTVLNYLGYERDYLAFGSDLLENAGKAPFFSIHYITGIYGLMKDGYYLEFDGARTTSLFDLKNDLMQRKNLAGTRSEVQNELETFIKAYLQQYNNRLIENRLLLDN